MKKGLFILSLFFLLMVAAGRSVLNYYIDVQSEKETITRLLPFIIIIGVLLAIGYLVWFRKLFPKGWSQQKEAGKLAIVIVFLILGPVMTRQSMISLDVLLPYRTKVLYEGVVMQKHIEKGSKGSKTYYFDVVNFRGQPTRTLKVSKRIYSIYAPGERFEKYFFVGPFGTRYAEE